MDDWIKRYSYKKKDLSFFILEKVYYRYMVQGKGLYKLSYTKLKKENIQLSYTYNLTSPQTHGGLRETILNLKAKARKVPRGRGLVRISAN